MDIKRSVTMAAFQRVPQDLSETAYNDGEPLSAIALHHAMYARVVGALNSQRTCSAIRLRAGVYASAKSNRHAIERPFAFRRARALFLISKRGRDAHSDVNAAVNSRNRYTAFRGSGLPVS